MRSFLFCCLIILMAACNSKPPAKPKTDWSVKLRMDKKPYGTWLANQSLLYYFPSAKTEVLNKQFRFTSIDAQMRYHPDSPALLAMAGLNFFVSKEEWSSLVDFAKAGNEVMIFAARLDGGIQKSLHFSKIGNGEERPLNIFDDGSENKAALSLMPDTTRRYGYAGHYIRSYFDLPHDSSGSHPKASADTLLNKKNADRGISKNDADEALIIPDLDTIPEILGRSKDGPDFIRYRIGTGHITLHATPLVLSNYFLLQNGNREYLDGIWHTLPDNISVIYMSSYEKRNSSGTPLSVLMRYPAIRAAFWLMLCTLILYVLFSLKKLQRKIAIVRPLPNESVSFVETIGRLYYNKGVHANLAEKMIQHFLDWVRSTYYLNTSQLNDTFIESLSAKSGKPHEEVRSLLQMIHDVRLGAPVDADYLHRLYTAIQSFYKS